MSHNTQHTYGFLLRSVVIGLGAALFALLFFADKTHLSTKNKPSVETTKAGGEATSDNRPALSPDANTDKWIEAAEKAVGKEKLISLDSVIKYLSARNRYDVAYQYAVEKTRIDSSLNQKLLAGELGLKALNLEFIAKDSVLREQFVTNTTAYLEEVVAKDSTNEQALMALGTAYILSRRQENSMKGILSIRKVTEINPKNVAAQLKLGEFSIQTGQYEKAETRFRNVLELQPQNEYAKLQLALVQQSLGKTAEAKKLATELMASVNDSIKGVATRIAND